MSFLCSVHLEGYLNYVTSMCQTFLFFFREILSCWITKNIIFFYLFNLLLLLLFTLFLRQKKKYILYIHC